MNDLLEKVNTYWLLLMLPASALVLLGMMDVHGAHYRESSAAHPKRAADILVLNAPRSVDELVEHWHPTEVLGEIRSVILANQVKAVLSRYPRWIGPSGRESLANLLVAEGQRAGIDPLLLVALIWVESAFCNSAISCRGARGLMQVMPATGEEMARDLGLEWTGPDQLHDPEINVRLGAYFLKRLLDLYSGNYRLALTAYNRGLKNVRFIMRRHGFLRPEFTGYYCKVRRTYRRYLLSMREPVSAFHGLASRKPIPADREPTPGIHSPIAWTIF